MFMKYSTFTIVGSTDRTFGPCSVSYAGNFLIVIVDEEDGSETSHVFPTGQIFHATGTKAA